MTKPGLTLCVILRVPPDGIALFLAYEDAVLPILADHGGLLERRLRTESGTTEFHLIWFPSVSHFDAFRVDPRRSAHAELLTQSGATSEILVVEDAAPSLCKSYELRTKIGVLKTKDFFGALMRCISAA